jgi:hypothetical protein
MGAQDKSGTTQTAVESKLDQLISLVAYGLTRGQSVGEAAPVLTRLGLTNGQIADALGSTPGAVSVRLAEAKNKKTNIKSVEPSANAEAPID